MFRELTRINKKLSLEECISILITEKRGVLSINGDEGYPYGMPMNHFYNEENGKIYFHCGKKGHRAEALKKDSRVSFCAYDSGYCNPGEWALNIKSVIVFGKIKTVNDPNRIVDITTKLCYKFTHDETYIKKEIEQNAEKTLLLELSPEHICGKSVNES
ncbi:MAG: pyridoxamine 5'-phosphate oxidase family protein [Ruminococcaceae bacterium]|nr:pyridoxamine 5'-phosphate oxidase family protein [Oscillospiraceae bacterium]